MSYGLVQERAPRKKKGKEKVVSLAEPVPSPEGRLSSAGSGKLGHALPETIGQIVIFYTTAQFGNEEYSDEDSGNGFRHEVSSLRVAAAKGAARFKTKKN